MTSYRLEGHKLYKSTGGDYVFVGFTPRKIKTLVAAIKWYETN